MLCFEDQGEQEIGTGWIGGPLRLICCMTAKAERLIDMYAVLPFVYVWYT